MKINNFKGFIALTSILIITVVALSISVSIAIIGIGEARNSLDFRLGFEAFKMAESCGEEGLLRSRNDSNYTGGTLNFDTGTCTISVVDTASGKQVNVEATVNGPPQYVKKIQIDSELDGNGVTIVTWQEVE